MHVSRMILVTCSTVRVVHDIFIYEATYEILGTFIK